MTHGGVLHHGTNLHTHTHKQYHYPRTGVYSQNPYVRLGDEPEALRCYTESHAIYFADVDVLTWLAAYSTHAQLFEKAVPLFETLSRLHPQVCEHLNCHTL